MRVLMVELRAAEMRKEMAGERKQILLLDTAEHRLHFFPQVVPEQSVVVHAIRLRIREATRTVGEMIWT